MPTLRFRHQQADELEARARAQCEERERQFERKHAGADLLPPPGAELLGSWFVIEEWVVVHNPMTQVSVEFEIFNFDTLTADGTVTGRSTAQGKNVFKGRMRPGRIAAGTDYMTIKGRINGPGTVRFIITPSFPPQYFYAYLMGFPNLLEANWNKYEMRGMIRSSLNNAGEFRAVKLEAER